MSATFTPLQLKPEQTKRAMLYVTLSETYQRLYNFEAKTHTESAELRQHLNDYYDEFVEKYGNLNEMQNVKFILMDANGRDALALERGENGQAVKLRTVEPMWIGNQLIPRNTTIVGEARLQGERLGVEITSIETNGSIYEVELQVFDSDGQLGINIPNSMESDALHEIGANMGNTMGSSINISTDAGAQIASDVGRGLINGVSQYLTKKMRIVKVHLKSGYRVMLHQPEQN